jgi:hypothetical protein
LLLATPMPVNEAEMFCSWAAVSAAPSPASLQAPDSPDGLKATCTILFAQVFCLCIPSICCASSSTVLLQSTAYSSLLELHLCCLSPRLFLLLGTAGLLGSARQVPDLGCCILHASVICSLCRTDYNFVSGARRAADCGPKSVPRLPSSYLTNSASCSAPPHPLQTNGAYGHTVTRLRSRSTLRAIKRFQLFDSSGTRIRLLLVAASWMPWPLRDISTRSVVRINWNCGAAFSRDFLHAAPRAAYCCCSTRRLTGRLYCRFSWTVC